MGDLVKPKYFSVGLSSSLFQTSLIRKPDGSFYYLPDQEDLPKSIKIEESTNSFFTNITNIYEKISTNYSDFINKFDVSSEETFWIGISIIILFFCILFLRRYSNKANRQKGSSKNDNLEIKKPTARKALEKEDLPVSLDKVEADIKQSRIQKLSTKKIIKKDSIIKAIKPSQAKRGFMEAFYYEFKETLIDQDKIMTHIILSIIIVYEGLKIFIASLIQENSKKAIQANGFIEVELNVQAKPDISNGFSEIYLNNTSKSTKYEVNGISDRSKYDKERGRLLKLTNDELRFQLKGVKKISRLKKAELIELIISKSEKVKQGNIT